MYGGGCKVNGDSSDSTSTKTYIVSFVNEKDETIGTQIIRVSGNDVFGDEVYYNYYTLKKTGYLVSSLKDEDGTIYNDGEKFKSTKDLKVYVSYTPIKYKIKFEDYNSYIGEENLPSVIECTYDQEIELPGADFEHSSSEDSVQRCEGWKDSSGNKLYSGREKVKNLCTENGKTITLTVSFYYVGKIGLVFCPNGYSWSSSNKTLYYEKDQKVDTSEIPEVTKTGYSLDGWYLSTDSEQNLIDFTTYTVTERVYFYPKFSLKKFTVTFVSDKGTAPSAKTLEYKNKSYSWDDDYDTSSYKISGVTGYTLSGWKNSSGEEVTSFAGIEDDITLTAIWTIWKATLYFEPGIGSGEMNSVKFSYDEKQALPKCTFYKNGYKFKGWAKTSTATEVTWADEGIIGINMTRDGGSSRIYALWEPLSTQISIDVKSISSQNDISLSYVSETSSFNAKFDGATEFLWFVDGEEVENSKSAYFSSNALTEGLHTIMVTSKKDGKTYSATMVVNVTIS